MNETIANIHFNTTLLRRTICAEIARRTTTNAETEKSVFQ